MQEYDKTQASLPYIFNAWHQQAANGALPILASQQTEQQIQILGLDKNSIDVSQIQQNTINTALSSPFPLNAINTTVSKSLTPLYITKTVEDYSSYINSTPNTLLIFSLNNEASFNIDNGKAINETKNLIDQRARESIFGNYINEALKDKDVSEFSPLLSIITENSLNYTKELLEQNTPKDQFVGKLNSYIDQQVSEKTKQMDEIEKNANNTYSKITAYPGIKFDDDDFVKNNILAYEVQEAMKAINKGESQQVVTNNVEQRLAFDLFKGHIYEELSKYAAGSSNLPTLTQEQMNVIVSQSAEAAQTLLANNTPPDKFIETLNKNIEENVKIVTKSGAEYPLNTTQPQFQMQGTPIPFQMQGTPTADKVKDIGQQLKRMVVSTSDTKPKDKDATIEQVKDTLHKHTAEKGAENTPLPQKKRPQKQNEKG